VHTGHAARCGLFANDLAAKGVKGGEHAMDGKFGFFHAYLGKTLTMDEVGPVLDASDILEKSSIKRYPVSGICQSVVLASERMAQRLARENRKARKVRIMMNGFEMRYPGNLNRGPFVAFGDKLMSAAFCSASVLANGRFIFEDFHAGPNAERDRLIAATEIVEDPQMPMLACRIIADTDAGTLEENVSDSRSQVAIEWDSVDKWAKAIWEEAGRPAATYDASRDAIRNLEKASVAKIPV